MSQRRRLLLMGLILVISLVVQAPAAWLADWLNQQSSEQYRLADVTGPWWAGEGVVFIKPAGSSGWRRLDALAWRLRAPLALDIRLGGGTAGLAFGWSGASLVLDQITLPADLVLGHKALALPTAAWGGSLLCLQAVVRWDYRGQPAASGVVHWRNMSTSMIGQIPLATVAVDWLWQPERGLQGKVSTPVVDALALSGDLHLAPGQRALTFDGMIDLVPASRLQLARFVSLIGQPVAGVDGRYQVRFQTGSPGTP